MFDSPNAPPRRRAPVTLDKQKLAEMTEMLELAAPNPITCRLLEANFGYTRRTLQAAVSILRSKGVPVLTVQGMGYCLRKRLAPHEEAPAKFREETSNAGGEPTPQQRTIYSGSAEQHNQL